MELEKAIRDRRSIRKFRKRMVPLPLIKKVIEAGTWAPSATNRQHWEFIVINDEKTRERVYKEAGAQKIILNAPAVIAVLYNKRLNPAHYANIQSVSAAVQNMLLKAHELGLGTCWMSGYGDEEKAKRILGVPENFGLLCLVLLGYPDEKPFPPPRKSIKELIHTGTYKGKNRPSQLTIRSSRWSVQGITEHQELTSRSSYLGTDYEIYADCEIKKIRDTIKNNLPANARVLNLLGYDGTILKKTIDIFRGCRVIDYELSRGACDFVGYKVKNIDFLTGEGRIGLDDNSMDLVLVAFSLEKIPNHNEILTEAYRVLKPGRRIIIFFRNRLSFYGLMYNAIEMMGIRTIENFYIRTGPFEPVSSLRLKNLLKDMGFSVRLKGIYLLPPELLVYSEKISGYMKRHGEKFSVFGSLVRPALSVSRFLFNITRGMNLPVISSSMCIIGKK